jgi:hypothetical protein
MRTKTIDDLRDERDGVLLDIEYTKRDIKRLAAELRHEQRMLASFQRELVQVRAKIAKAPKTRKVVKTKMRGNVKRRMAKGGW